MLHVTFMRYRSLNTAFGGPDRTVRSALRRRCTKVRALILLIVLASAPRVWAQDSSVDAIVPIGWGGNSRFAYLRLDADHVLEADAPRGGALVVQNLVTDEVLLTIPIAAGALAGGSLAAWWQRDGAVLTGRLDQLGIDLSTPGRVATDETLTVGRWEYAARFEAGARRIPLPQDGGAQSFAAGLEGAILLVHASNPDGYESFKIVHEGPEAPTDSTAVSDTSILGYVLSPDQRRAAIIYRWSTWGEANVRDLAVVGSHLVTGFTAGARTPAATRRRGSELSARELLADVLVSTQPRIAVAVEVAIEAVSAWFAGDQARFAAVTDLSTGFVTYRSAVGTPPTATAAHAWALEPAPGRAGTTPRFADISRRIDGTSVYPEAALPDLAAAFASATGGYAVDPSLIARIGARPATAVEVAIPPVARIWLSEADDRYVVAVVELD